MTDGAAKSLCYLDTNVFIGAFEKPPEDAAPLLRMFERFRAFPGAAIISELTLAQLFVPPFAPLGMPVSVKRRLYLERLVSNNFIGLRPVTRSILLKSADLPRPPNQKKHSLPDAIHMATAIEAGCSLFMTEDKRIRAVPESIIKVQPDASGIETLLDALRA